MEKKDPFEKEMLPAELDEKTKELARSIRLEDPTLSTSYGADTMRNISRFADDLLVRVRTKDAGEIGETLNALLGQVKEIDLPGVGQKKSFPANLPLIGSLFNRTERSLARYKSLADQVEAIAARLENAMTGLLYDIQILEQLYEHNKNFHKDLSRHLEAGKLCLEKAREEDLPRLVAEAEQTGDSMAAQQVRDFSEQLNRFERRLHDLQLSRTITLQTAPQIRLIQSNDQTLAEKIQTSILSTIPIWKSQIVLGLTLQGQQNAAALQKRVADTTNTLLKHNAEALQQSTIETARQVERAVVDVDTLKEVHGKLLNTIEETLRIAQDGRSQRIAAEKELLTMEEDLKTKLLQLADRKDEMSLEAARGGKP
ncbi:toxic anion resistance protein [Desulfococcaceae bacterium OttesenSCG-928-F15]|nr:toxic anion resistance protein [Desulfococcaceae bacterium OttesenSCG-928-F15]